MHNPNPIRVCLYVRCGTKKGADCDWVSSQIARGWFWCASQGFTLANIIVEDRAGPEAFNRPSFNRMLKQAQRQPSPFDIILIDSPDRFSRCATKLAYSARLLSRSHVRLATVTGSFPGF